MSTPSETAERMDTEIVILLLLSVALGAEIATGIPGTLGIVAIGILFSLSFAAVNPATYAVDAARAIMLDRDVITVLDVPGLEGMHIPSSPWWPCW